MSVWLIEPLDPLIARDGRPAAVGHFRTVNFPHPSMIAGAVRTRMGSPNGAFTLPANALTELCKNVLIRGPLLAELDPESEAVCQWFAPAPRDAMILAGSDDRGILRRLVPRPLDPGEAVDSLAENGLQPVGFHGGDTYGKPPKEYPSFWTWTHFQTWLTAPEDRPEVALSALGIPGLPVESRSHLAIQPGERVGIDGMLFITSGLRFLQEKEPKTLSHLSPRRFALSLWCESATVAGCELNLRQQIAPLGGERRLARWSPAASEWPQLPESIKQQIVDDGQARLVLLTPAVFADGALPGWNGRSWPFDNTLRVTVAAACVPRPEVVSGWDLATGRPKPTRRLAPAGSVYFVKLAGEREHIARWCDETWFACVSDDEQGRCDGFGLAALGTWEVAR